MTEQYYVVWHFWKGDKWSDPQWVHSGTYCTSGAAQDSVKWLKGNGYGETKIQQITKKVVSI